MSAKISTRTANSDSQRPIAWYRSAKRDLPWRANRDPYRIWVAEVMLQQTTVVAVIPYYERFMKRFATLKSLAQAPLAEVLEHWAGLGYYSRARNLHKAAVELNNKGFPRTHAELLELPGFGPYTARAVSSLAFDERAGVLDGNVIRVLSRMYGLEVEWWKPAGRARLQAIADELAQVEAPAELNQGLMELGATICTPASPACLLCPWTKSCIARDQQRVSSLPLKKPRRAREIWHWCPTVVERGGKVLLTPNDYAPFLKGHWILPGEVKRLSTAPKTYDYRGTVTHHDIFVTVARSAKNNSLKARVPGKRDQTKWVDRAALAREIPASLIRKAIEGTAFEKAGFSSRSTRSGRQARQE